MSKSKMKVPGQTWPGMIESVLKTAMYKGKLFPILFSGVMGLFIYKMPPEDLGSLAGEIYQDIKSHQILGYVLACITLLAWFIHLRLQRRVFTAEMKRATEEKTRWQKANLGDQIESSRT